MFTTFKKLLPVTFSLLIIAGLISAYFVLQIRGQMLTPLYLPAPVSIYVKQGSSIRVVAEQLSQQNLLSNKNYFILWGRLNKQATRLQAGEYTLDNGQSLADFLQRMVAGDVVQHSITLVEGFTFKQMMSSIRQSPFLEHTLQNLNADEVMEKLGHAGEHPEGRFFPDTYYVFNGMKDTQLLQQAYQVMENTLNEEWLNRKMDKDNPLPFETPYEALILASIVEKETAVAEERPLIAGVFINRLKKKMRLQTDPTVIYGIENYDGNIRYRDLRKDTPYNTYTRSGLTPTPIAMPGREAIHAVLHPDKTDKLYFVAYSDGSGRHVFSSNLKDHEKAVDKYQRKK